MLGDSHVSNHTESILKAIKDSKTSYLYNSLIELKADPLAGRRKDFLKNLKIKQLRKNLKK